MNDYRVYRCLHDGMTLTRLPPIDPRGPEERAALARAKVAHAWRTLSPHLHSVPLPKNVLRFGGAK